MHFCASPVRHLQKLLKKKTGRSVELLSLGRSGWVDLGHLGEEEWLDNEGGDGGVCTKEKISRCWISG